ncbi:MAG: DNA ligase-associated DEXH box helicase, partial [Pseudomonadota bacterium]
VFKWRPQADVFSEINDWWRGNAEAGRASVIGAYSLGKAQRVLAGIDPGIGPIYTHGAVENTNDVLREQGLDLPATTRVTPETGKEAFAGSLVVAPPSAFGSAWMRRLGSVSTGFASGWMALRGVRRRRAADRGFVLSDHVDWVALNDTIRSTGAERVFVTHGYTSIFRRWLEDEGYDARIAETEFEGEVLEEKSDASENGQGGGAEASS